MDETTKLTSHMSHSFLCEKDAFSYGVIYKSWFKFILGFSKTNKNADTALASQQLWFKLMLKFDISRS
jgi:hypothetical protein